jgi:hypothetical protein
MKVTLLGHASLLIELDGANVLMDPVFQDPFQDGAVVACPQREILVDRLPRIDKIAISHAHLDHFDLRSLDRLPRHLEVLCPEDPVLPYALGKLGFRNVRTLAANAFVDFGTWQLLTTYSDVDVIEVGMVFRDRSGACWNEVDSVVNPATVEAVRRQMGHIDLLFTGYASQNVAFFESMRAGYPLGFTRMNLANVRAIAPGLAVPGSAGYRFAGVLDWTNAFLFPIACATTSPKTSRASRRTSYAQPRESGRRVRVGNGTVVRHEGASDIARMIEDDTWRLAFDATAAVPPLVDTNVLSCPGGRRREASRDRSSRASSDSSARRTGDTRGRDDRGVPADRLHTGSACSSRTATRSGATSISIATRRGSSTPRRGCATPSPRTASPRRCSPRAPATRRATSTTAASRA